MATVAVTQSSVDSTMETEKEIGGLKDGRHSDASLADAVILAVGAANLIH